MSMNQQNVPQAVMAKYRGDTIDYVPLADLNAGTVIPLGTLVAINSDMVYAGRPGALNIEGVYDVTKYTNDTFKIGDEVYWDSSNSTATAESGYSSAVDVMGICVGNSFGVTTLAVSDLASNNSTTVTSASGVFAAICVGAQVSITGGTNWTVGVYTITARASSTSVTFSANPTNGSSATVGAGLVNCVGAQAAEANVRVKLMPPRQLT